MTSANVISLIAHNEDFIVGFWVGFPFGLILGVWLFAAADDVMCYIFRKFEDLKERRKHERIDD